MEDREICDTLTMLFRKLRTVYSEVEKFIDLYQIHSQICEDAQLLLTDRETSDRLNVNAGQYFRDLKSKLKKACDFVIDKSLIGMGISSSMLLSSLGIDPSSANFGEIITGCRDNIEVCAIPSRSDNNRYITSDYTVIIKITDGNLTGTYEQVRQCEPSNFLLLIADTIAAAINTHSKAVRSKFYQSLENIANQRKDLKFSFTFSEFMRIRRFAYNQIKVIDPVTNRLIDWETFNPLVTYRTFCKDASGYLKLLEHKLLSEREG